MSRILQPEEDQVVYHYCSAETLRAILETRTIRFTDINMLNDSLETKWGYSAFEEAATRLIKRIGVTEKMPDISLAFIDSVDEILSAGQFIGHPFISCFSLDGDSLGQWRAYADDGRGFAIGFRASMIKQLPLTLLSVEYEREKQIKEMMAALYAIYVRKNSEIKEEQEKFFEDCALTAAYMTGFKHSAFRDEKEIRCLHVVNVEFDGKDMHFVDPGGQNDSGHQFEGNAVKFQVRDNHLSAYFDMPFCLPNTEHPISEIVLGPKNHSALGNIFLYLGGLGYSNVGIRNSTAPYR